MKRWLTAAALLSATALQAAPAPRSEGADPNSTLVGKWAWTLPGTQCTETYDYRPDGKLYVISGDEKSDNTYEIVPHDNAHQFIKIQATIVKDHGGEDCTESSEDNTGGEHVFYLVFQPGGEQHAMCPSAALNQCVGPLRRVP